MLLDQQRAMKHGLSRKMRSLANNRRCPKCGRGSAISTIKDESWCTKYCRYCDYEKGFWLSNTTSTGQEPSSESKSKGTGGSCQ